MNWHGQLLRACSASLWQLSCLPPRNAQLLGVTFSSTASPPEESKAEPLKTPAPTPEESLSIRLKYNNRFKFREEQAWNIGMDAAMCNKTDEYLRCALAKQRLRFKKVAMRNLAQISAYDYVTKLVSKH